MNKQLPTREQVIFVPCDDVRQEIGNKFSFMGVYTDSNRNSRQENKRSGNVSGQNCDQDDLAWKIQNSFRPRRDAI